MIVKNRKDVSNRWKEKKASKVYVEFFLAKFNVDKISLKRKWKAAYHFPNLIYANDVKSQCQLYPDVDKSHIWRIYIFFFSKIQSHITHDV